MADVGDGRWRLFWVRPGNAASPAAPPLAAGWEDLDDVERELGIHDGQPLLLG